MRKGISLAGTCEVKEAEQSGPLSFCCCRGWLRKMHVFFRMIAVCGRAKKQLAYRGIDVLEIQASQDHSDGKIYSICSWNSTCLC